MLSWMIHVSYDGSGHRRKITYAGYVFFLQCRHLHIPHESLKKAFYWFNVHQLELVLHLKK